MPEVFEHAPVRTVIFQLRFAGETAIEIARPHLQDAIRDQLPKLYVPRVVPEVAPALQPYVFRSADDTEGLELALNSMSYVTERYEGYAKFKARALHFVEHFREAVPQVETLNRVGLRYVNHFPFLRESKQAAIPLDRYLNVSLDLPDSISGTSLTELNTAFSVEMGDGTLRVVVRHESNEKTDEERLVLDFDFAQGPALPIDRIEEYLEKAHAHTKRIFLGLISEQYLPVMRGDE